MIDRKESDRMSAGLGVHSTNCGAARNETENVNIATNAGQDSHEDRCQRVLG
jgi:hypothetical protein